MIKSREGGRFGAVVCAAFVGVLGGCGGSRPSDAVEQVASALNPSLPGRGSGLLWRTSSGELLIWDMMSSTGFKQFSLGTRDLTQWKPVATGDFNADGAGDIFWRSPSQGLVSLWNMADTRVTATTTPTGDSPSSAFQGTTYAGDLDGDGVTDLIWTGTTAAGFSGTLYLTRTTMMNAGSTVPRSVTSTTSTSQRVQGVGNFDGDLLRRADVLRRTVSGDVSIAISGGATISLGNVATSWVIKGVGDFNADGTSDILWYNTTTGEVVVWVMLNGGLASGHGAAIMPPNDGWSIQGIADADHDGISDIIWRHSALSVVSIWMMGGPGSVREFGPGLFVAPTTTFAGVVDLGPPSPALNPAVVGEFWQDGRIHVRVQFSGQEQRVADFVEVWESVGGGQLYTQRVPYHREFAPNTMAATIDTSLLQNGSRACFQLRVWEQGRVSTALSNVVCAPGLAPPVANWDWQVADRFGGDSDRDGAVDLTPSPDTINMLHAGTASLTLDACTLAGDFQALGVITSYVWNLQLPTGPLNISSATCRRQGLTVPRTPFNVTLTVTTQDGRSASVTKTVAAKNHLIVSLGDSFGSGEGNPVRDAVWDFSNGIPQVQSQAFWGRPWDALCHRTANAGPARAALALERSDPHSSVTFLSTACSGAVVANIVDTPQVQEDRGTIPLSQIQQVRNVLCPPLGGDVTINANCHPTVIPKIDALLISIGGNDVEFSDIIETCILQPNPFRDEACRNDFWFLVGKEDRLEEIPDKLTALRDALAVLNVSRTYITEYPDGVHVDAATVCDEVVFENAIEDGTYGAGILVGQIDGVIGHDDLVWASGFIDRLNQSIQTTVAWPDRNWTFVTGVDSLFNTHGYCVQDHWMTHYGESKFKQRDEFGSMHPNIPGHNAYARRILASFITNGLASKGVLSFIPAGNVFPPINP